MGRVAALLVVGLVLAGCTQDGVLSEVDTEDPGSPSDATTPSTVVAKNAQTTTTSTTTAPTTSVTSSTAVQRLYAMNAGVG